jgi:hypothetical protein
MVEQVRCVLFSSHTETAISNIRSHLHSVRFYLLDRVLLLAAPVQRVLSDAQHALQLTDTDIKEIRVIVGVLEPLARCIEFIEADSSTHSAAVAMQLKMRLDGLQDRYDVSARYLHARLFAYVYYASPVTDD